MVIEDKAEVQRLLMTVLKNVSSWDTRSKKAYLE